MHRNHTCCSTLSPTPQQRQTRRTLIANRNSATTPPAGNNQHDDQPDSNAGTPAPHATFISPQNDINNKSTILLQSPHLPAMQTPFSHPAQPAIASWGHSPLFSASPTLLNHHADCSAELTLYTHLSLTSRRDSSTGLDYRSSNSIIETLNQDPKTHIIRYTSMLHLSVMGA